MTPLSDNAVARLQDIVEYPSISGSRYEIVDRVGEGAMGAVYLAHDRWLHRDVALKVLRAPTPTIEECARLRREAHVLASLEHPGIVPVHDVGTLEDGRVFYVMKRVRGERLDEFARMLPPRTEVLRVFLQVCDAVSFAHAAGVIHRDLKPQNIMLGPFGEVLVLDWGVAKVRDSSLLSDSRRYGPDASHSQPSTGTGVAIGTPGYMAPEQMTGVADERSDIYGLGGVLIFLLAGKHPRSVLSGFDEVPEPLLRDAPAPLRAICARARAADSANRYRTVAELRTDIAAYLAAMPVAAHREGFVERARRLAGRHRTALLLVAAYLLMRVALLAFVRS